MFEIPFRRRQRKDNGRLFYKPGLEVLERRDAPAIFSVINIDDSGAGSLRQAMLDANASPGADTIAFNIPGAGLHTIRPTSLPAIVEAVTIDGYTQPGASANTLAVGDNAVLQIEISGVSLLGGNDLFRLMGTGGSTVTGLVINRFPNTAITIGQYLGDRSNDNTITGNFIGTDAAGTAYVPGNAPFPFFEGIRVVNGTGTKIGGTAPANRNVIAGGGTLIELSDGSSIVQGNYLGVNAAGTAALQAADSFTNGIVVGGYETLASGNLIGGTEPGAGNVIVSSRSDDPDLGNGTGIILASPSNLIQGNFIGTNATGTAGLDGGIGIDAGEAQDNTIAGNLISGNEVGISRFALNGPLPVIRGNKIGTDITGTAAIPNVGSGIQLDAAGSAARGGLIGGLNPGDGNTIAFNGGDGVTITDGSAAYSILGNSIFSNSGLGIANGRHSYPTLTSVTSAGGNTTVQGTLDTGGSTYRIEFFANDAADPSGFGEGQTFLGFADVTTSFGIPGFTVTLPVGVAPGQVITATATDPIGNTSEFSAAAPVTVTVPHRRPVLIVPGIGGTYVADLQHEGDWLLNRGVPPDQLRIDPINHTYDALIETLKNAGYVEGQDLFIATYDWRLSPGPDDGVIDGHIDGLTAALNPSDASLDSITDDRFQYGVDYLGYWLRQAAEEWARRFGAGTPLDAVDVIVHSTGGLVARAYIESDAYGGSFNSPEFGALPLPRINNLIMTAVPNRGATLPWNPLNDNFIGDVNLRVAFSSLIDRAYKAVVESNATITGTVPITLDTILDADGRPSHELFIEQYVPTLRALLATYDFLQTPSGSVTNVNQLPDVRNNVLLDLNNGLDLTRSVGDFSVNDFADRATVSVIYGENLTTPTQVSQHQGEDPGEALGFGGIVPFDSFFSRHAAPDETWYEDVGIDAHGDSTVPLDSSRDQFVGDNRVTLYPFRNPDSAGPGNTTADIAHGPLMSNIDVQKLMLQILGQSLPDNQIVTDGGGLDLVELAFAIGFPFTTFEKLGIDRDVELTNPTLTVTNDAGGKSLDFAGGIRIFGSDPIAAAGHLTFNDGYIAGAMRIGLGSTQDLNVAPGVHLAGNFAIEINTSFDPVTLDPRQLAPNGITLAPEMQDYLTIPAHTVRLIEDGGWQIGGLVGEGILVLTPSYGSTTEFDFFANGSLDTGAFAPLVTDSIAESSFQATVSGTLGMVVENDHRVGAFGSFLITRTSDSSVQGLAPLTSSNGTFNFAFNTTSTPRPVAHDGVTVPAKLAELKDPDTIDPFSARLLIDAEMQLGIFSGQGTFFVELDTSSPTVEFQVYAKLDLGVADFMPLIEGSFAEGGFDATMSGSLGLELHDHVVLPFGSFLITRLDQSSVQGLGALTASSNTFNVAFNLTGTPKPVAHEGVSVPAKLAELQDPSMIDPFSARLLVDGTLQFGPINGEGTLLIQERLDRDSGPSSTIEFQVLASLDLDLGVFAPLLSDAFIDSTFTATISGTLGMVLQGSSVGFFGSWLVTRENTSTVQGLAPLSVNSTTFNVAFNTTPSPQPAAPAGVNVPAKLAALKDPTHIDPTSVRIVLDANLQLGVFTGEGTYLVQAGIDVHSSAALFQVFGSLDLGIGIFSPFFGSAVDAHIAASISGTLGRDAVLTGLGALYGSFLVTRDDETSVADAPLVGTNETFNIAFNASHSPQSVAPDGITVPAELTALHNPSTIDPFTVRLLIDGKLQLSSLSAQGTYIIQADLERATDTTAADLELQLYAHAAVDLTSFVNLGGAALSLGSSQISGTLLGTVGLDVHSRAPFGALLVTQDAGATSDGDPITDASNTFNIAFNVGAERTIQGIDLPTALRPFLHLDAQSVRLFMERTIEIGGFAVGSALMLEVASDRLIAFASGHVALGLFGAYEATGFLRVDGNGTVADLSLTLDPTDLTRDSNFQLDGTFSFEANTRSAALAHDDPLTPGFDETSIQPGVVVQVRDAHFTILGIPVSGSFAIGFAHDPARFFLSIPSDNPLTFSLWHDIPAAIYGDIDTTGLIDIHVTALFDVGVHDVLEIGGKYNSDVTNPQIDDDDGVNGLFTAEIERTDPHAAPTFSGSFEAELKILTVEVASFSAAINECGYAYFTAEIAGVDATVYADFNNSLLDEDLLDPDTSTTAPGVLITCEHGEPPLPIVQIAPAIDSGLSAAINVAVTPDNIKGGNILKFTVAEGDGANAADLAFNMPGLPDGGSVTISYTLVPLSASPTTADPGSDFIIASSGSFTIDSSTATVRLPIPIVGDSVYEKDEIFELTFDITSKSGVENPILSVRRVHIKIANDDRERPPEALVFYNFDQSVIDEQTGARSYGFTRQSAPPLGSLVGSDFAHSDDTATTTVITPAPGVFKILPDLPAEESQAAAATGWTADGQKYFQFQVDVANSSDLSPFDFVAMLDGIDFWDEAGAGGPATWELYSSLDKFKEPLAIGVTHADALGHNIRVLFECIHVYAHDVPLTFRLVGRGGEGSWAVDNVALLGSFDPFICNDAPNPGADSQQIPVGIPATIDVLGNDSDPNNDPLTIIAFTPPAHGSLVLNADSTFTYTTDPGFFGPSDSFTYRISDGNLESPTTTVTLTFINDKPIAIGQTTSATEDTPLPLILRGTDADTATGQLVYKVTKSPGHGTLTIGGKSSNGQAVTYMPAHDFNGFDSFRFTVTDRGGLVSSAATVNITVGAVNDAPKVTNPTFFRDPGHTGIGNVLDPAYASDPDNDAMIAVMTAPPLFGTLSLNPNGTFVYLLSPIGQDRDDAFRYVVLDGHGGVTPGIATIRVAAPTAGDQSLSTPKNTLLSVSLSQNVQPTGVHLSYTIVSVPPSSQGTLVDTNRQIVFAGERLPSATVIFRPAIGFVGTASFRYQANFGTLTSNAGTIRINVTGTSSIGSGLQTVGSGTTFQLTALNDYVTGATVFFDANENGVLDFLDINGNTTQDAGEPTEPSTVTDLNAVGTLTIPTVFDRNGNGMIDPNEGRLVATGGIMFGTGLPLTMPLLAPIGSSVITPLTTLISLLADEHGLTPDAAMALARTRLGLADFDLTQFDHIAQTVDGNPDAPVIAAADAAVHDIVAQVSALFARTPQAAASYNKAVSAALTDLLQDTAVDFNFANPILVERVIQGAESRLGIALDPSVVTATATVIADGNQRIEEIAPVADLDFLTQLAQVQEVALGRVAGDLALFGAGNLDADLLLAGDTGAALDDLIALAAISDILPSALPGPTFQDIAVTSIFEGDTTTLSGSIANPANHALTLELNWGDGRTESVSLAPGATSFAIPHRYLDNGVMVVSAMLISDGSPSDVANTTLTVTNVAPIVTALAGPNSGVRGQQLLYDGSFSDPGADAWTGTVNFGDGSGDQPLVLNANKSFAFQHVYASAGNYVVVVKIADDDGGFGSRALTVGISANRPPLARDDEAVLNTASTVLKVLANDLDPDGDHLIVTAVTQPASGHGNVTINADGSLTYQQTVFVNGAETFTYTISDDHGGVATARMTLTVELPAQVGIEMLFSQVLGEDLGRGQQTSLTAKLNAAQQSLARDNTRAAANELSALANEVRALERARTVAADLVDLWLFEIENIAATIGQCE